MKIIQKRIRSKIHMGSIYMVLIGVIVAYKVFTA